MFYYIRSLIRSLFILNIKEFKVNPTVDTNRIPCPICGSLNVNGNTQSEIGVQSRGHSDAVKNLKNLGIPETIVKKAAIDNPRRYLNVK